MYVAAAVACVTPAPLGISGRWTPQSSGGPLCHGRPSVHGRPGCAPGCNARCRSPRRRRPPRSQKRTLQTAWASRTHSNLIRRSTVKNFFYSNINSNQMYWKVCTLQFTTDIHIFSIHNVTVTDWLIGFLILSALQ